MLKATQTKAKAQIHKDSSSIFKVDKYSRGRGIQVQEKVTCKLVSQGKDKVMS